MDPVSFRCWLLPLGSDESTREFIQLRFKLRHLFNGRRHVCAKAYRRIVEELGLTDYITPTQARKKWTNLVQKYKNIKGGCSTASEEWPYFQILDAIVPLMRKEAIEMGLNTIEDKAEITLSDEVMVDPRALISSEKDPLTLDSSTYSSIPTGDSLVKCRTEFLETEPPLKKQRGRRAAQKARAKWWGAVEDEEFGSDSGGSATRGESSKTIKKTPSLPEIFEPTDMELKSFHLLKSCADSLAEIQETLQLHAKHQQDLMEKLTQTVAHHGDVLKTIVTSVANQNATLHVLTNHLSTDAANIGK
ncbi:hypothetical protein SK128_001933 [Halocaridina rubra]|uniref:Myb/SANT-like DNA-binding domain-containing protein n=1 Tax=Halocaridina rubra TaxID=373956 RepID=A0AAN8X910_HALRR